MGIEREDDVVFDVLAIGDEGFDEGCYMLGVFCGVMVIYFSTCFAIFLA